jgi:hypothetical protein
MCIFSILISWKRSISLDIKSGEYGRCRMTFILFLAQTKPKEWLQSINLAAVENTIGLSFRMLLADPKEIHTMLATSWRTIFQFLGQVVSLILHFCLVKDIFSVWHNILCPFIKPDLLHSSVIQPFSRYFKITNEMTHTCS